MSHPRCMWYVCVSEQKPDTSGCRPGLLGAIEGGSGQTGGGIQEHLCQPGTASVCHGRAHSTQGTVCCPTTLLTLSCACVLIFPHSMFTSRCATCLPAGIDCNAFTPSIAAPAALNLCLHGAEATRLALKAVRLLVFLAFASMFVSFAGI